MLVLSKEHEERRVENAFQQFKKLLKSGTLQERDTAIALEINKFRFMTRTQIEKLFFEGKSRACQNRLLKLYNYGVLDRFRPASERGKGEYIYCLDQVGAYLIAQHYNYPLTELKWRKRDNGVNLFYLEHFIEVVDVYMEFRKHDLKKFEVEEEQKFFKPDAYAEVVNNGYRYYFFIEVDRATEREDKIAAKIKNYEKYYKLAEFMPMVMFVVPDKERQQQLIKWIQKYHQAKKIQFFVTYNIDVALKNCIK